MYVHVMQHKTKLNRPAASTQIWLVDKKQQIWKVWPLLHGQFLPNPAWAHPLDTLGSGSWPNPICASYKTLHLHPKLLEQQGYPTTATNA